MEVRETEYRELKSIQELQALAKAKGPLAIAFEFTAAQKIEEEEPEEGEQKSGDLLFDAPSSKPMRAHHSSWRSPRSPAKHSALSWAMMKFLLN